MNTNERTEAHRRIEEVECILHTLADAIPDVTPEVLNVRHPIVFIMGCARSGTTLVSQFLAKTGAFCYPTNFISRFYFAPYIGALLQRLMFDLDAKGELFGYVKEMGEFESVLGKTRGPLSPNEFWYFWRRFFKFGEIQLLDDSELARVDVEAFVRGLRGIQTVFDKPIFLKGMIANWHIPYLAQHVPNSYFIIVERDLLFNAQSLYLARREYFDNVEKWYSFKPAEYPLLKNKTPFEQVAGQVKYTNDAIDKGVRMVSEDRVIRVRYEQFCERQSEFVEELNKKCSLNLVDLGVSFPNANVRKLDTDDWERLQNAAKRYL